LDHSHARADWLESLLQVAKANGAAAAIAAAEAERSAKLAKEHEDEGWDAAARLVGHQNRKQRIHYVIQMRAENRELKNVRGVGIVLSGLVGWWRQACRHRRLNNLFECCFVLVFVALLQTV